jgi:hypothetical protein
VVAVSGDNTHICGIGDGSSAVDGLIPAGFVAETIASGDVIKIKGLQHNMYGVFMGGDIIRLDTVAAILGERLSQSCSSFFGEQIKAKGLGKMEFVVIDDVMTNNNGECWVKVLPKFSADPEDPYQNIDKPIPEGERVFCLLRI